MKVIKRFLADSDRYEFDAEWCSPSAGWAQLDSYQDASYFGTWISARERAIVSFCEGDVTEMRFDADEELLAEVRQIEEWNAIQSGRQYQNGYAIGIDPMLRRELREELEAAGLGGYLH